MSERVGRTRAGDEECVRAIIYRRVLMCGQERKGALRGVAKTRRKSNHQGWCEVGGRVLEKSKGVVKWKNYCKCECVVGKSEGKGMERDGKVMEERKEGRRRERGRKGKGNLRERGREGVQLE